MSKRSRAGKKASASDGGGDAVPSKKTFIDIPQIDGYSVKWEWEGDGKKWIQYSNDMNSIITDSFNSKKKQIDLDVAANTKMQIKFDTMVQKNKKTGWERRVRCSIQDPDDEEYYIWQFEEAKNVWSPYPIKTALELEKSGGKGTVEMEACHRSYVIDVAKREQCNTVTKVKRDVDRVKSDASSPDPSTSVTPAPSTSTQNAKGDASTAGTGKRGRSAGTKIKKEPDLEENDEEANDAATKSKGSRSAKSAGKKGKSGRSQMEEIGEEVERVRTVVVKGKAPVDPECTSMLAKAHVFSEGNDVWDCMLNQTNVGNNNNKYYLIQILKEDTKTLFYVWQRWGRVGYRGQDNLVPCGGDLDKAKNLFTKKFSDKTKNNWYNRSKFQKIPGKYDLLEMDYGAKDEPDAKIKREDSDVDVPDSKIDQRLQNLMNLICDIKAMEDAVKEMKYDAKKAPLGKLNEDQITAGYAALKKIDNCITKGDFGKKLTDACSEFYTRIPHDFGMKTPPVIRDKDTVELKIQLLEALGDIEIAVKTLKAGDYSENPVDRHYHALKCELNPMDKASDEFKMLNMYLQNTHAATHNQYKMVIEDIFELDKEGESENFVDHGNRMLLWHGSRLTNWVGILSRGLRIAPPEAPVTGYMFGKGVYFADMSSKSANYCFASRAKNVGLLLLSEVSLGKTNDLLSADYNANKLPAGKHSVTGLGAVAPDPTKAKSLPCGTVVPLGKSKDTGVTNPSGYTLNYNEFIVYDTKQIKMKYLLKVKFNFK